MRSKNDVMGMNKDDKKTDDDKGTDDDTTTTSTKMTSDERKSLEMLVLPPLPSPMTPSKLSLYLMRVHFLLSGVSAAMQNAWKAEVDHARATYEMSMSMTTTVRVLHRCPRREGVDQERTMRLTTKVFSLLSESRQNELLHEDKAVLSATLYELLKESELGTQEQLGDLKQAIRRPPFPTGNLLTSFDGNLTKWTNDRTQLRSLAHENDVTAEELLNASERLSKGVESLLSDRHRHLLNNHRSESRLDEAPTVEAVDSFLLLLKGFVKLELQKKKKGGDDETKKKEWMKETPKAFWTKTEDGKGKGKDDGKGKGKGKDGKGKGKDGKGKGKARTEVRAKTGKEKEKATRKEQEGRVL